jgi:hypothetical protein
VVLPGVVVAVAQAGPAAVVVAVEVLVDPVVAAALVVVKARVVQPKVRLPMARMLPAREITPMLLLLLRLLPKKWSQIFSPATMPITMAGST